MAPLAVVEALQGRWFQGLRWRSRTDEFDSHHLVWDLAQGSGRIHAHVSVNGIYLSGEPGVTNDAHDRAVVAASALMQGIAKTVASTASHEHPAAHGSRNAHLDSDWNPRADAAS